MSGVGTRRKGLGCQKEAEVEPFRRGDAPQTPRTNQRESLGRGQAVAGDLLEAGDDAGTGHGFSLSHPKNPLIRQHHVAGHAEHHVAQLDNEKRREEGKESLSVDF